MSSTMRVTRSATKNKEKKSQKSPENSDTTGEQPHETTNPHDDSTDDMNNGLLLPSVDAKKQSPENKAKRRLRSDDESIDKEHKKRRAMTTNENTPEPYNGEDFSETDSISSEMEVSDDNDEVTAEVSSQPANETMTASDINITQSSLRIAPSIRMPSEKTPSKSRPPNAETNNIETVETKRCLMHLTTDHSEVQTTSPNVQGTNEEASSTRLLHSLSQIYATPVRPALMSCWDRVTTSRVSFANGDGNPTAVPAVPTNSGIHRPQDELFRLNEDQDQGRGFERKSLLSRPGVLFSLLFHIFP